MMRESKFKIFFQKVVREMSLWSFRNLKVLHELRRLGSDNKNPVLIRFCDCGQCRARQIRRQFSMSQEEGFEVLVVSCNNIRMTIFLFFYYKLFIKGEISSIILFKHSVFGCLIRNKIPRY